MTKKHLIALADTVRNARPSLYIPMDGQYEAAEAQWELMRDKLAEFCAIQSPNFNRQLWLDYIAGKCGPSGGKVKA